MHPIYSEVLITVTTNDLPLLLMLRNLQQCMLHKEGLWEL